jgi:uncharacterized protein
MGRVRVAGLVATALLMASPMAWAAGFDCARAKQPVELRICKDEKLSKLDEQLTQSFASARARAGKQWDALLRDQRNWLAERNALIYESDEDSESAYQDRILFLDHLFKDSQAGSPLLQAIGEHMSAYPSTASGTDRLVDWWSYISGSGKVFSMGAELTSDDTKSFPFNPKDVIDISTDAEIELNSDRHFVLFDAEHLGGVYADSMGMQYQWTSWQLFTWGDHKVKRVDLPDIFKPDIASNHSALSQYKNAVYALRIWDTGLATSNITAQPYLGDHWGEPAHMELRYDTYLAAPESYCAEKDCTKLTALAAQMLGHYYKTNDVSTSAAKLSSDQVVKFTAMQQQAKKEEPATMFRYGDLAILPDFHQHPKYMDDGSFLFFDTDTVFPIQWQGELLLAKMGDGCYSPAEDVCDEDVLLGIWRWDGHVFTPVLGMVRKKLRGDFLIDALIPADLHVQN